jgi:lysozyme
MSTYYNTTSIIGGPLDSTVLEQLKQRKKLLDKKNRNYSDLVVLNSSTAWIRLMSSIDVLDESTGKYTSDLAKKYIMQGGTLSNGRRKEGFNYSGKKLLDNASYELAPVEGFVPMPGIDAFVVQSKNQFGTLRVGTVEFKASSIQQLSELERIFLRPGFTVLLEWGHSVFLDNSGNMVNSFSGISPDEFFTLNDKATVIEKIAKAKKDSSHNYDAIFAFVKNFSWSFSSYGQYDCKIDLVSIGEVVESLQAIVDPGSTAFGNDDISTENTSLSQNTTPLHQFLYSIKTVGSNGFFESNTAQAQKLNIVKQSIGPGYDIKYYRFTKSDVTSPSAGLFQSSPFYTYVPLYLILATINETMCLKDSNGNIITFYTGDLPAAPLLSTPGQVKTPFVTFPWHFILDPNIGFLPKQNAEAEVGFKFASQGFDLVNMNDITNICINVDHAIGILDSVCTQPEITDQVILNFLKSLLVSVQDAAGQINEFDFYYAEDEFRFYIVDRNVTPSAHIDSTIDVAGLGSTVESLQLSSRMTSKISSQVASSAQVAGTDAGDELLAMQKWNYGLQDRIISTRNLKITEAPDSNVFSEDTEQLQISKIVNYVNNLEIKFGETWTIRNNTVEDITGLKALHRRLMTVVVKNQSLEGGNPPPGLIPLNLDLRMLGIGSIKVGQAFHIPDVMLPASYRSTSLGPKISFMVFDPTHTISNGRWVTNLRCGMVLTEKTNPTKGKEFDFSEVERKILANSDFEVNTELAAFVENKSRRDVRTLSLDSAGLQLIKDFEGFRTDAYVDPGSGNQPITIGYGTTRIGGKPVTLGTKITQQQAEEYLKLDVIQFENSVKNSVTVPLSQGEFNALVSFTYNAGAGNLAKSSMLSYTNQGQYEQASLSFSKWTKASGQVLKGLVKRRTAEANMYRTT